jgi:hypothetical protein
MLREAANDRLDGVVGALASAVDPQPAGDDHLLQEVDLDVGTPGEAPREGARDRRLAGAGESR